MYSQLPKFNDDDLGQQIENIAEADSNIFQQIAMLTHGCDWHEKMALATNAIVAIDDTHTQLCIVQPKHGRYSENLAAAIQLLRHLSSGAKAELAVDILSDDWELGSVEDAPSIIIEDRFDENFYHEKTFSERCKEEGIDPSDELPY